MTQVLDLRALVLATGRFDAERDFKLRWPASLRVEVRFQGGDDVPPDVFMARCRAGFLREVAVLGDVHESYLPVAEMERWARDVCAGSFGRSLVLDAGNLCSEVRTVR